VGQIFIPDFAGDLRHAAGRPAEQLLRRRDAEARQVAHGGVAEGALEARGELADTEVGLSREIRQAQRLGEVRLHVGLHVPQQGFEACRRQG